jgi:hypothetical protein
MEKLYLLYVNYIGMDYKGNHLYEFIFCDTIEDIDGEEWDTYPASGRPHPPHDSFIKKVGRLESEFRLDVVQHSDTFAVWDAVDGVIALAWENVDDYETYPDKRICFKFGEALLDIEGKLYEKDLILNYNLKKHEHKK